MAVGGERVCQVDRGEIPVVGDPHRRETHRDSGVIALPARGDRLLNVDRTEVGRNFRCARRLREGAHA